MKTFTRRSFLALSSLTIATAATAASLLVTAPSALAQTAPFEVAVVRVEIGKDIRSIVFKFLPNSAPNTVRNFKRLVKDNFYDGQAIHRAIPDFLVQTGDPFSTDSDKKADWGTGSPGYTIPEEISARHGRGAVAMARLGDDVNPDRESNGSQFYFALNELSHLDGKYTVFGQVLTGYDVLDAMAAAKRDSNDIPYSRIEVKSIRVAMSNDVLPTTADAKPVKKNRQQSVIESSNSPISNFIKRIW